MNARAWALAAGLACAAAGFVLLAGSQRGAFDFQAFYCAGAAVRAHADPYRMQPLQACEHAQTRGTYAAIAPDVAVPAPLPGYDLALFALLAMLPFTLAKALWGAVLALAIAAALLAVRAFTGLPFLAALLAFAASLVMPSLGFGELFPLFAAAACAAAYFAQRGDAAGAGIAAAAALVEPNLGLPLCIAVFFAMPRARTWIAAGLTVLAAVSPAVIGIPANLEYFTHVLPLQALSDLNSDAQFGIPAMLRALGASARLALTAGGVCYVALAAFGIWAGKRLAQRLDDGAFLVAAPAAFAVAGSSYIHVGAWFAALPLALLFVARGPHRAAAGVAAALLAVPWFDAVQPGNRAGVAALGALAAGYLIWISSRSAVRAAVAGAAACVALLAIPVWYANDSSARSSSPRVESIDERYPQAGWQRFNAEHLSSGAAATWVLRGASWAGFLLLAGVTGVKTRRRSRPSVPRPAAR